jgi:hypothetical protein
MSPDPKTETTVVPPAGAVPAADPAPEKTGDKKGGRDRRGKGGGGGGGKVADPQSGNFVTDTAYLPPIAQSFAKTPFGRIVPVTKSESMRAIAGDVAYRCLMYAVDYKGYFAYGTSVPEDEFSREIMGASALTSQWFPAAREFLAKAQPELLQQIADLTNTSLPKQYYNVYATWVGNMVTMLNVARLGMMSAEFSELTKYFPRFMGRITRNWRRGSTLPVFSVVRDDAISLGAIGYWPGVCQPVLRFYNLLYGPTAGGPATLAEVFTSHSATLAVTDDPILIISDVTKLGYFVEWLEGLEGWLERGTATILTDFLAMKDMMNRVAARAELAGSIVRGLPGSDVFPGLTLDKSMFTDILTRLVTWKEDVTAGVDIWYGWPLNGETSEMGYVPVFGLGTPSLFDYVNIGVPKFIRFASHPGEPLADVNDSFYCDGTRHHIATDFMTDTDARAIFGHAVTDVADELYVVKGTLPAARGRLQWMTPTADILANLGEPYSVFANHVAALPALLQVTGIPFLEELDVDYVIHPVAHQMAEDTIQLLMQRYRLPTLRWAAGSGPPA